MLNLWSQISNAMNQAAAHIGRAATYRVGDTDYEITAIEHKPRTDAIGPNATAFGVARRFFLLPFAQLPGKPTEGNRLRIDAGGRLQTFQLTTPEDGSPLWDWMPGNEWVRASAELIADATGETEATEGPTQPRTILRTVRWNLLHTVATGTIETLAKSFDASDSLQIIVDIGAHERTLPAFNIADDFALLPPNRLDLSALSVAVGDRLIITNFGTPSE